MAKLFSKHFIQRLAVVVVGILLFTQVATATQFCALPQANPAHAFGNAMAMETCEGVPMSRWVCLADCLKADQISHTPAFDLDIPPLPAANLAELPTVEQITEVTVFPNAPQGDPGGLSLQILFCSLQI